MHHLQTWRREIRGQENGLSSEAEIETDWWIGIPGLYTITVPGETFWGIIETVVAGVTIAYIGLRLAKHRFKTERWYERRGEAYGKIGGLLRTIARHSKLLSDRENHEEEPEPKPALRFSHEQYQVFGQKRDKAHTDLTEVFEENRYLLSTTAVRIVERYLQEIDRLVWEVGTTSPQAWWNAVAARADQDFSEIYQVDVGPEIGVSRHLRRIGRDLSLRRLIAKNRLFGWRLTWRLRLQRWRLQYGPQLTQKNVRTPPRSPYSRTVEEMESLGWDRIAVQRELRQQLRDDPPPWDDTTHGTPSS